MPDTPVLQHTPLHSLHEENGAKMVSFAGYEMPIQYTEGIIKEHLHTRGQAGLFDVSHMGQVVVRGENAAHELEALIPIDVVGMRSGEQKYGFFTNADGGIEDDLMVSRWDDHYLVVVNAACKAADFAHMQANMPDSTLTMLDDALIALQGPKAASVMQRLGLELDDLPFMHARYVDINGISCRLSRSGYTGEDGFEIAVSADQVESLARQLQSDDAVRWIGLGARDTLRLEGGMCLYGHDIDATTTPVEAALTWAISGARRSGGPRQGGFPGDAIILPQIGKPTSRKRVGMMPDSRAPVREGTALHDEHGNAVGMVTSGGFSPTLRKPIAMGYVTASFAKKGSLVFAQARNNNVALTVVSPTFVPNQFYRP